MRQQSPQALVLTGAHGCWAGVMSGERYSAVEQTLTVPSMMCCAAGHLCCLCLWTCVRTESIYHQLTAWAHLKESESANHCVIRAGCDEWCCCHAGAWRTGKQTASMWQQPQRSRS